MYILYAPPDKFGKPFSGKPICEEVRFYNNVAFCPKHYWYKLHLYQGFRDITPRVLKKLREKRILRNILVVAKGGLGDSMWTMPVIKAIRAKNPQAVIAVATEEKNAPVWQHFPYANMCVADYGWNLVNMVYKADEAYDFGGVATIFKKEMKMDPVDACFKHIGYPLPKTKKEGRPHLVVTIDEGKRAEALLKRHGADPKKHKIISLVMGSSTPNRDWPLEYHIELSRMFPEESFRVLWISDKRIPFQTQMPNLEDMPQVVYLCGETSIRMLMAIIALSDAVITPVTAPLVIATALETPTVGLFGAFTPKNRTKYYEKFTALEGSTPCRPCQEHWTECPHGHPAPCMKSIRPQQVYQAVLDLLRQYPKPYEYKRPLE